VNGTQLITGEVVDTSYAYKESVDSSGNIRPKGTIVVRTKPGGTANARTIEIEAAPFNVHDYTVPLIGEHVTLITSISVLSNIDKIRSRYYYTNTVNILDNINSNIFKGSFNTTVSNISNVLLSNGIRNVSANTTSNTLKTFTITDISPLQPFEGDRLIQSRNGSSLRFSSTVLGNTSIYSQTPTWSGLKNGDPIITIANGIKSITRNASQYAIENINDDASSLYLTSTQQIDLSVSHPITLGLIPINTYQQSQIIANSNRIILNASDDALILAGKKTVSISTPGWSVDMDKMFTQINTMQQQLVQLTTQLTVLTTLIQSAATADIPAAIALSSLGVVLSSPNVLTAGTPNVTSQLANITAELSKVTATLATLKQ
jgi:hypothetical protein